MRKSHCKLPGGYLLALLAWVSLGAPAQATPVYVATSRTSDATGAYTTEKLYTYDYNPTTQKVSYQGPNYFISRTNGQRLHLPGPILIYTHGVNNSVQDAVTTAGRLQAATGFKGSVIVYDWPSQKIGDVNSLQGFSNFYAGEITRATAAASTETLKQLIYHFRGQEIHILSHSLGGRPTERALHELISSGGLYGNLASLTLFASDIDSANNHVAEIVQRVQKGKTTIIYNPQDFVLNQAKEVQGTNLLGITGYSGPGVTSTLYNLPPQAFPIEIMKGFPSHTYWASIQPNLDFPSYPDFVADTDLQRGELYTNLGYAPSRWRFFLPQPNGIGCALWLDSTLKLGNRSLMPASFVNANEVFQFSQPLNIPLSLGPSGFTHGNTQIQVNTANHDYLGQQGGSLQAAGPAGAQNFWVRIPQRIPNKFSYVLELQVGSGSGPYINPPAADFIQAVQDVVVAPSQYSFRLLELP